MVARWAKRSGGRSEEDSLLGRSELEESSGRELRNAAVDRRRTEIRPAGGRRREGVRRTDRGEEAQARQRTRDLWTSRDRNRVTARAAQRAQRPSRRAGSSVVRTDLTRLRCGSENKAEWVFSRRDTTKERGNAQEREEGGKGDAEERKVGWGSRGRGRRKRQARGGAWERTGAHKK